MGSFSLTEAAKSDLRNIANFTEKRWDRQQRRHYLKGLDDTFQILAESPKLGNACDYIAQGLRKHSHQSHMIYYDTTSDTKIQIVRVLHKRMDVQHAIFDI